MWGVAMNADTESKKLNIGKNILNLIPNLFKKFAHGVSFFVGVLKKDSTAFQIQKKSGDELLEELNKVQKESNEYRNQSEID